jgi:hypothetical protein
MTDDSGLLLVLGESRSLCKIIHQLLFLPSTQRQPASQLLNPNSQIPKSISKTKPSKAQEQSFPAPSQPAVH